MNLPKNSNLEAKNFWDSLHNEIIISNQDLNQQDIMSILERNFIFSVYFRGCSQLDMISFQKLFQVKDNGYIVFFEMYSLEGELCTDFEMDEYNLISYIREIVPTNITVSFGPLIYNRISLLVSMDQSKVNEDHKHSSVNFAELIKNGINDKYNVQTSVGIGNIHSINSINHSFIEGLCCLQYCELNHILHFQDLQNFEHEQHIDYIEAEKRMLEAIRLRKLEAYDFFSMIINLILPLNDEAKRNKILEIIVLANHEMRKDYTNQSDFFNYFAFMKEMCGLQGHQLIEWAYQKFIYLTGHNKTQNSIDYTNKIALATKEYLEAHYTEDISLEDVAEQVNISPQYFSKLIKKTTGLNFIDWLSMLRVKKAKELFNTTNLTVKEVCFMVGYKDPNYFSRIFKKRIGITPSEYVKNIASNSN